MASLRGIVKYCYHLKPNDQFKPHKFKVDLELDEKGQKEAKALGLKLKPKDENHDNPFVAFSSYVTEPAHLEYIPIEGKGDGRKPRAYTKDGSEYKGVIGNGSECNVVFRPWEYSGGVKALWRAIQVFNLELPEGYDEDYEADDGFTDEIVGYKPTQTPTISEQPEIDPDLNDNLDDL